MHVNVDYTAVLFRPIAYVLNDVDRFSIGEENKNLPLPPVQKEQRISRHGNSIDITNQCLFRSFKWHKTYLRKESFIQLE